MVPWNSSYISNFQKSFRTYSIYWISRPGLVFPNHLSSASRDWCHHQIRIFLLNLLQTASLMHNHISRRKVHTIVIHIIIKRLWSARDRLNYIAYELPHLQNSSSHLYASVPYGLLTRILAGNDYLLGGQINWQLFLGPVLHHITWTPSFFLVIRNRIYNQSLTILHISGFRQI